jgi:molecular chaperone DnaK (HSP70)
MIFRYVKADADKFAKASIKDVVLVLPNYYNIHQRNFFLQAAAVAEIDILSIITENTGAAINYALNQRNSNKT